MESVALSRVSEAPATTIQKAMEILVYSGQGEAVIAALDEAQQSQQAKRAADEASRKKLVVIGLPRRSRAETVDRMQQLLQRVPGLHQRPVILPQACAVAHRAS